MGEFLTLLLQVVARVIRVLHVLRLIRALDIIISHWLRIRIRLSRRKLIIRKREINRAILFLLGSHIFKR